MRTVCLIFTVVLLTLSCDRQKVYEQFITLDHQTWESPDKLKFNVNINDTASAHNVYLVIRNTGQYEYSNLYLFVTAHSPNGNVTSDTTEIILADEHGKWLGEGSTTVFTLYYPYRRNIRFPFRGIYQFEIEQAMWVKDLEHVSHVGLRIERANNRN